MSLTLQIVCCTFQILHLADHVHQINYQAGIEPVLQVIDAMHVPSAQTAIWYTNQFLMAKGDELNFANSVLYFPNIAPRRPRPPDKLPSWYRTSASSYRCDACTECADCDLLHQSISNGKG